MDRYNSINKALKTKFGCKVFKVSLVSGLGCPNRCVFCSQDSYLTGREETLTQGIEYIKRRHGAVKFISYFQSGTNTHGPADKLRPIFTAAIKHKDVVGLAIGTRPDSIANDHLDLLEELSKKTMLWVELGLQSANDDTLKLINRGHNIETFANAARALKQRNISIVAHVILGLPNESLTDMIKTANFLNELDIDGVKIHNLHVLKGTLLEKWYEEGRINIPDLKTYADWVVDFLEHLKPSMLIHRVNGHAPRHLTVAPLWSINKLAIFNAVEKELKRRDSFQGKKFSPTASQGSRTSPQANQS